MEKEWDDYVGGHQMLWSRITNNNAGQKNQQGIIEFNYVLEDKFTGEVTEKTFSSICKSNV